MTRGTSAGVGGRIARATLLTLVALVALVTWRFGSNWSTREDTAPPEESEANEAPHGSTATSGGSRTDGPMGDGSASNTSAGNLERADDFAREESAFWASSDAFSRIALVEAWVAASETRALPILAQQGARGEPHLRGAVLQALGSLGRVSRIDENRSRAYDVLVERVWEASRRPDASTLGDGLIACDALVQLGWRGEATRILDALAHEDAIAWTLAERIVLVVEALGLPERSDAGKLLARYLTHPPNAMFRALPRDDAVRMSELAARLGAL